MAWDGGPRCLWCGGYHTNCIQGRAPLPPTVLRFLPPEPDPAEDYSI